MTLIRRMAWVIDDGVITKVFYPVFPPDRSAEEVVSWISDQGSLCARFASRWCGIIGSALLLASGAALKPLKSVLAMAPCRRVAQLGRNSSRHRHK